MQLNTSRSQNNINKKIYQYPMAIVFMYSLVFIFLIYGFIENFKKDEIIQIKEKLISHQKNLAKNRVLQISNMIDSQYNNIDDKIKQDLKNKMNEVELIINTVINLNKNESTKKIKKMLSDIISPIRFFGGNGYYFAFDKTSLIMDISPIKKPVGKSVGEYKDDKGQLITKLVLKSLENKNDAFINNVYFEKPNNNSKKVFKKLLYVKYIKKLNMIIGVGQYYDEVYKTVQNTVLKNLKSIKYEKNNYLWVHDKNYILISHPYRAKSIGKSDINLVDKKGTKIIQMFFEKSKLNKNGSYVQYYWKKPNEVDMQEKISYVKHMTNWGWVIGTGVYLEDIENIILKQKLIYEKRVENLYINLFIVLIIILIVTLVISNKLAHITQKEFTKYTNKLNTLNNTLDKKVMKRTNELNNLNKSLSDKIEIEIQNNNKQQKLLFDQSKNAQMGEMIGNIAHQWRQPLSAISSNATGLIVQKEYGLSTVEKDIKSLNAINDSVNFLSNTIDTFTNYIKENKEVSIIILQDSINNTLNIVSSTLSNNYITLENNINKVENIEIKMIQSELSQVLINIINNAKDIILEKNINNPWIKVDLEKFDNKVIITIEDNAGGIPDEILDKIFTPYFTTKHQSQGTGLGLHMSKDIIEKSLSGVLNANNSENGAVFSIELPLSQTNL